MRKQTVDCKTFVQMINCISEIENGAEFVDLNELLSKSDFVIVNCSLTPETQNLFDIEKFRKMKKTAMFINTSRGGIFNLFKFIVCNKRRKQKIYVSDRSN
jgi:lactate dehydrogenase-like 2-hydroxyacid dehydrogenase